MGGQRVGVALPATLLSLRSSLTAFAPCNRNRILSQLFRPHYFTTWHFLRLKSEGHPSFEVLSGSSPLRGGPQCMFLTPWTAYPTES